MRYDSKFFQSILTLGRLSALNILWLICCIPVITSGAASAALYYTLGKLRSGEEGHLFRLFCRQFHSNLRCGMPMACITAASGLICLYFAFSLLEAFQVALPFQILSGCYTLLYLLVCGVIWPLVGHFQNSMVGYFISAISISIRNFPVVLIVALINSLPLWLCLLLPSRWLAILFVFALVGKSITALLNDIILGQTFRRYASDS